MGLASTLNPGRHWLAPLLGFFGSRTALRIAANDEPDRARPTGHAAAPGPLSVARPLASAPMAALPPRGAAPRRLRVVSLPDASSRPGLAGRMVISGRLADVCAELERLEALAPNRTRSG